MVVRRRPARVSRPARVGLAALAFVIGAAVLLYFSARALRGGSGYQIGVRFPSAAGVNPGAQVFLSGVDVGTVSKVIILPDASVDFILTIFRNTDISRSAKFSVQTSLTGSPSVAITPPILRLAANQTPGPVQRSEVLPKYVLPVAEQPVGVTPLTLEAIMGQGKALGNRASAVLALAKPYGARLQRHLQNARANGAATAQELQGVRPALMGGLQSTIARAKANAAQAQTILRQRDQGKLTAVAAAFTRTAGDMKRTAASLDAMKRDPQLRASVQSAQVQLRSATANLAKLSVDLQRIAGSAQTKAELRDAGARLHAILQRL